MSSYTSRTTQSTGQGYGNTTGGGADRNEAGFIDKMVGKAEEKIGELKKDPKMQQEGAIRATDGKAAAENFKEGAYTGSTGAATGLGSTGHNTSSYGAGHTGTTGTAAGLGSTGQNTSSYGAGHTSTHHNTGGLHDSSRADKTDQAMGKAEAKIGEWKKDPQMQQEGAIRATEGKRAAENYNSGATGLGGTGSTGLSGHNTSSYDAGQTGIHQTTGGVHDATRPVGGLGETTHGMNDPSRTQGAGVIGGTGGLNDPSRTGLDQRGTQGGQFNTMGGNMGTGGRTGF